MSFCFFILHLPLKYKLTVLNFSPPIEINYQIMVSTHDIYTVCSCCMLLSAYLLSAHFKTSYDIAYEPGDPLQSCINPEARFSQVPKSFRARKATTKVSNLNFTGLFFSHIFNMNKFSLHAKFHAYTLLCF